MKITPQICPQCSGPLRIAADRQTGICDYCKTTVALQTSINSDRLNSLIQSGMDYMREGDFNSAEQQGKNIIALDSSRGEGWLLKAATNFDIAQADQSFENGLRKIDEASRQEFALIFKQLALYVWKKANQMLVRDVEKRGMSRAAKQHYEIKAKAAQLSAFAIELFPLAGWADEVAKYTPIKSWEEHSQAEKIERFDILTAFDSKSASDLTAFIACRERFLKGFSEHLPDEYATLVQQSESARAETMLVEQPRQAAGVSRRTRVVIYVAVGAVAFISAIIAGMRENGAAHDKNKAVHEEFERTMAEWLADHPGQTPSLPRQDVFDEDGYTFHRNANGRYELWRHERPVVAK